MLSELPFWVPVAVLAAAILFSWLLEAHDRRIAKKNGTEWQGDRGPSSDSEGGSGDSGGGDGGGGGD